ncbi:MAG: hypothetical protein ACXVLT_16400, partial [Flavisolibacter sp.]
MKAINHKTWCGIMALCLVVTGCRNSSTSEKAMVNAATDQNDNGMVSDQLTRDSGFYDSHFHITNYIQEGISIQQYLKIMGNRVGRSTLFGIP